jgi:hypothetical protein
MLQDCSSGSVGFFEGWTMFVTLRPLHQTYVRKGVLVFMQVMVGSSEAGHQTWNFCASASWNSCFVWVWNLVSDKPYVICTVHFSWLYKIVIRQMYTLYYLIFNRVYIKNSPTCFELCYSSSSGTQLFITPYVYSWCNKQLKEEISIVLIVPYPSSVAMLEV